MQGPKEPKNKAKAASSVFLGQKSASSMIHNRRHIKQKRKGSNSRNYVGQSTLAQ